MPPNTPPRLPFWIPVLIALLAVAVGAVALWSGKTTQKPLPVLGQLPPFALVDQDARPFGLADLEGKVWVANFIFTRCPTVCPLLTQKMAGLQRRTSHLAESLRLVSFSVDPDFDKPQVLKAYGERFGREPARWTMLTGSLADIESTIIDSFKVGIERGPTPDAETPDEMVAIVHGEHFVLVDVEGRIRGYYANDKEAHRRLIRDVERLIDGAPQ